MCDASNYAVCITLEGNKDNPSKDKKMHAIYYASITLYEEQINYETIEKELLVVVFAINKFCSYLVGSIIIVYIDHANIKYVMSMKNVKPRLLCCILLL